MELSSVENIVIWGAGKGIGLALVEELLKQAPLAKIFATYRTRSSSERLFELAQLYEGRVVCLQADVTDEDEIKSVAGKIKFSAPSIDLLINCIGILHNETMAPEKRITDVDSENLWQIFAVNSVATAFIAKHFHPMFDRSKNFALIALSAKVGSIEDNRSGGWYGYRASKAALNMFVRNLAIEFGRTHKKGIVAAIHPGTTMTDLSRPFTARTNYKVHTPEETASNICSIIAGFDAQSSGKFFAWNSKQIPW